MEDYKKFLKYTEMFLNKHADKLNMEFNQDESSVSIALTYSYWNAENKITQEEKIISKLKSHFNNVTNTQSGNFQIYLNNRRMNNLTKAWFNNARKLSSNKAIFNEINKVCFNYMNLSETLEYLKDEEKEYAEIVLENSKNKKTILSSYEILATLEQIKRFMFSEDKLNDIVSKYLLENVKDDILESERLEREIFSFVRENFSENKWINYIQYFPKKAYLINPKEEDKKTSLFACQHSKLTLEIDREYISQKYTSLILDSDVVKMLNDFSLLMNSKNYEELISIKNISSNEKITYLVVETKDNFNEENFKSLLINYVDTYGQNKMKTESLSEDFVSKTIDYLILDKNVNQNINKVRKNKI